MLPADPSYPGKSGDVAVHRSGDAVILWHRKSGSDATPHPGWWLLGRTDGLADFVLEGPDWVLIDGKELFQLVQHALRWPRWKWRCLLRFHHWPTDYTVVFDMCGRCCPWPCCGAITVAHATRAPDPGSEAPTSG